MNSCSIVGLDELIKDLGKFALDAMPALNGASIACAQIILPKAIAKSPPGKTGMLAKSIKLKKITLKSGAVSTQAQITCKGTVSNGENDAWYGVEVELGHRIVRNKMQIGYANAKPFLRPAADESKEEVYGTLVGAMNKELERLGDK